MTLCYRLFGHPRTRYEFLDKAKQTDARTIDLHVYLDKNLRSSVDATTDTDKIPFILRHRKSGNLKCRLNKYLVDADTLDTVVRFANRLRAQGYDVHINDKPIGYAEEVLAQVNTALDHAIQRQLSSFLTPAERAHAATLPPDERERYLENLLNAKSSPSS